MESSFLSQNVMKSIAKNGACNDSAKPIDTFLEKVCLIYVYLGMYVGMNGKLFPRDGPQTWHLLSSSNDWCLLHFAKELG